MCTLTSNHMVNNIIYIKNETGLSFKTGLINILICGTPAEVSQCENNVSSIQKCWRDPD